MPRLLRPAAQGAVEVTIAAVSESNNANGMQAAEIVVGTVEERVEV